MAESIAVSEYEMQEPIRGRVLFPPRQVLYVLLVCAGYYAGALIAKSLKFPDSHLALIWPPTAIVLAALLLTPPRKWWVYLLAVPPVHIFLQVQDGVPGWGILSQLVGNFGQALVAATSVRYFIKGQIRLDSFRAAVIFTLCAVILAPFLVSGLAAYLYVLSGWEQDYWYAWRARVSSNALSTLTIVPPILLAVGGGIAKVRSAPARRYVEFGLLVAGLVVAGFIAFGRQTSVPTLLYTPLPFLLWAAVRFEMGTLCLSLLVTALLAFLNTSGGQGPFATQSTAENVLSLQLFLITISLPLMFLAGLISERRHKEEALGESEARYRALVLASADTVWLANERGEGFFATQGWQSLTGQNEKEMRGFGWLDAVHAGDRERSRLLWKQAVKAKHVYEDEFRVCARDGSYRHFHVHAVPILAPNGNVHEWVAAITDITHRKEAELEATRQRAELAHISRVSTMGELAVSLAHELNQPLTAILSNAQAAQRFLAANPAELEDVREILKDIVQDNNRAGEVIRRMRALVKKEERESEPLNLASVIGDVVMLVHSDAVLRNIRVLLEFSPGLPMVWGERIQLQQVALNLLLNAFEAMKNCPADERRVVVQAEVDGAGLVKVAVRDCGMGLTSDTIDKIFQPFYTTKGEGLGMGLSISRSIIEAHGGRLWAEKNPDRGATFYFTVPLEKRDEGQVGASRI